MATLTIEIPDELMDRLAPIVDQLPELLRRCLHPSVLSPQVYCYVLDFLASQPTPEQVAAFRPTLEMQNRLQYLLARSADETITPEESHELDEYGQIEHLIVLFKNGSLPYLTATAQL